MKKVLLAILAFLGIGLASQPKRITTPKLDSEHFYGSYPGFRRAMLSEVTPEMQAAARRALREPLGTRIDYDGFLISLETHYDPKRKYHKGATVFLREDV